MNINKRQLDAAVDKQIITSEQANNLFEFLNAQGDATPRFSFTHVLYYLGGLIAIGAMTLFMTLAWQSFGGVGIVVIAALYGVAGIKITNMFAAKNLNIPAGISATFVVFLTPLAVYGLLLALGVWPHDDIYRDYHRFYMEVATLAVGAILLWRYRYPFLMLPIAVTLWYLSMDIVFIFAEDDFNWQLRALVSLYFGLLMISLAFWVDIRSRNSADYAFWLYIFGAMAFWCGLSFQSSDSELAKFLYLCINLVMIAVGVLLVRRVFVVFGALGSCGYLGYLAFAIFDDSWLFPLSLTVIGFAVVYLGVVWQKHEKSITAKAQSFLPVAIRELLMARQ